jgi:ketosteroid isomerase-like protein
MRERISAMRRWSLVAAAILIVTVLAQAQEAGSKDGIGFEELRKGWIADLQEHRMEESLARYAPDAAFLNPDGTHAATPKQMRFLFGLVFGAVDAKITMTARTTAASGSGMGSLAYDSGSYVEDLAEKGGGVVHHISGDYMTVYRKEAGGQWLIVQQMWTLKRALQ